MSEVHKSCYRCGYVAVTAATMCPQCRSLLHSFSATRVRGGLMVVAGLLLTGLMGYLLIWAWAAFSNTGSSGARFTGTDQEKLLIIGLFSILILFGIFSLATGSWQLIFGRRNNVLSWVVIGIGIILAVMTAAIIWGFNPPGS